MSKLNEKIKTEEPILTFNIVNIILIKELVTSNEGSLDGKMVRCKFIYKRRRKPRDRFKILMPKVRMLTLREFRHVFLHAEPQFDSETSDVCSKMAGREKGEFAKLACTRNGESRKIPGNITATENARAKLLRTSSKSQSICLSSAMKIIRLNYRTFHPAEWIYGDSFLGEIQKLRFVTATTEDNSLNLKDDNFGN